MSKKEIKKINIYLTQKECKSIREMKYKYHISISTISSIVLVHIFKAFNSENSQQILKEKYLYQEHGNKTSIKPRYQLEDIETGWKSSLIHTNCLKIFLNRDLEKYVSKELANRTYSKIYNEFQNTYEENWNGNQMSRFIPKFIKQNKEYVKKVLEVE